MSTIDPHIWTYARQDYATGANVGLICASYDIPRSTFYARANREGWLRADEAREAELEGQLQPLPDRAPPCRDLAALALDRAADALFRGDLRATEGWTRAARRFRDMAVEDSMDSLTWQGILERERHAALKAQAASEAETAKTAAEAERLDTCPTESDKEILVESEACAAALDSPTSPTPPPVSNDGVQAMLAEFEAVIAEDPAMQEIWRKLKHQEPEDWFDEEDDEDDEEDP